ncbi:MAG TPA: zinc ribbon domain-containing protein [Candidatus Scatomonas pullistercoris]|uniref:Zinc ribbon domain-containing protein n=1 Tax=Candidatus Scatomonas pullistercoris TaxID=2840920 RepID=A0A9D1TAU7_9FIRM|nr:zinc ribbon domain-containing protein [Candidatus Scatomonas pullistercoris]
MKYCRFCGTQLDDKVQVCPECGRQLTTNISDDVYKSETKQKKINPGILIIIITAVIVVCVLIVALLLFVRNKNRGTGESLLDNMGQFVQLELNDSDDPLIQAFRNRITYRIADIEWEGDLGNALVIIYTPDLAQIIQQAIGITLNGADEEEYQGLLQTARDHVQEIFGSDSCPMLEQEVQMEAQRDGEDVVLVSNEQFEKAIAGNLEELYLEALREGILNDVEE